MEARGEETHCTPTGLMGASLPGVTLRPVSRRVEGRDADQVLGVAGQVLQLQHGLRQEQDLHLLCFVLAVCLPVVNLLERVRGCRQAVGMGWQPHFGAHWGRGRPSKQDCGPEPKAPGWGHAVAGKAENRGEGSLSQG